MKEEKGNGTNGRKERGGTLIERKEKEIERKIDKTEVGNITWKKGKEYIKNARREKDRERKKYW